MYIVGGNPFGNASVVSLQPVSNMRGTLYQVQYPDADAPARPPPALKYAVASFGQATQSTSSAGIRVYGGAFFRTNTTNLTPPLSSLSTFGFGVAARRWYILYSGTWLPLANGTGVNVSSLVYANDFIIYFDRGTLPTAPQADGPGRRVGAYSTVQQGVAWYVYGGYTTAYNISATVACDLWVLPFRSSTWSQVGPTCACADSLSCTAQNSLVAQYSPADLAIDAATSTLYFIPQKASYSNLDRSTPAAFMYPLGANQWSVAVLPGSRSLHLSPPTTPLFTPGAFALFLQSRTSALDSKRRILYQTVSLPDTDGSIKLNIHSWQFGSGTCNTNSSGAVCRGLAVLNSRLTSQALRHGQYTLGDFNSSYYCDCDELHGYNMTTEACEVCPPSSVSHMGSCQGISYCAPWTSSSKRSLTRVINDTSAYLPTTDLRVVAPAWHSIPLPSDAITPDGAWNNYLYYTANVTSTSIDLPAITSELSCMDFDPLHRQIVLYAVTALPNGFNASLYSLSLATASTQAPGWKLLATNFSSSPVSVGTWPPLGDGLFTACSISIAKTDSRKPTPQLEFITSMEQMDSEVPPQRLLTRTLMEAPGYAYPGFPIGTPSRWPVASSVVNTPNTQHLCNGVPVLSTIGASVYSKHYKMWLLKETITLCQQTLFFSVDLSAAPQALSSTTRDGMFYHDSVKQGPNRTEILADPASASLPYCIPNTEAIVAQDSFGIFVQIGGLCKDTASDPLAPINAVVTLELVTYNNGTRGYIAKNWPSVSGANGIAPRWGHSAAFDRDRNWIWVFGGYTASNSYTGLLNDLQILDFSSKLFPLWRNDIRLPGMGSARPYGVGFPPPGPVLRGANIDEQSQGYWPSPRMRALMTYVPRMSGQMGGGHLVIVGGVDSNTLPLNDTHMLFLVPSRLCPQSCYDYAPASRGCTIRTLQLTDLFVDNQMITADDMEWQAFPFTFPNTQIWAAAPEVDTPKLVGGFDASAFALVNQIGVRGLSLGNLIFNGTLFPPGSWEALMIPRIFSLAGSSTTRRTSTPFEPFGDTSFAANTQTTYVLFYYHDGYLLAWNLAARLPPQMSYLYLFASAGVPTPIPYLPPRVTVDRPNLLLRFAWTDAQHVDPGPARCSMPTIRAAMADTENHTVVSAQLYPVSFSPVFASYYSSNMPDGVYCTALDSVDACGSDTIPWSLPAHSWKTTSHRHSNAPLYVPKPAAWLYAPCSATSCLVAFISGNSSDPALYGATMTLDGSVTVSILHHTNGNLLHQFGEYGLDYMLAPAVLRNGVGCVTVLPTIGRSVVHRFCQDPATGSLSSEDLWATNDSDVSITGPLAQSACVYVVGSTPDEADFIICAGGVVLGGSTMYTSIGLVMSGSIQWTVPGANYLPANMFDMSITYFNNVVYLTAGQANGMDNWDVLTMTRHNNNNTWGTWTVNQLYTTPAMQRNVATLSGSTIWVREQQGKPYLYAYPSMEADATAGLWTLNPTSPVKSVWLSSDDVSRFDGAFTGSRPPFILQAATVALPFGVMSLYPSGTSSLETRSMVYGVHSCRAAGATCRSLPAIPEASLEDAATQYSCECGDPMYAGLGTSCYSINACPVYDINNDRFIDGGDLISMYESGFSEKCTGVVFIASGHSINGWAFGFNAWFPNATTLTFTAQLVVNSSQTLTSLFGVGGKPNLTVIVRSAVFDPAFRADALLGMKLPDAFSGLQLTNAAKIVDLHPALFDGVAATSSSKFVLQTSATGAGLRIPSTMLRLLRSTTGAPSRVTWLADGPSYPNRSLAENSYYCLNRGPQEAAITTGGSVAAVGTVRGAQVAGLDPATSAVTFNLSLAAVLACVTYRKQEVNQCSNSLGLPSTIIANAYKVTKVPDVTRIMNAFAAHFLDGDAVYIISGDGYDTSTNYFTPAPTYELPTALRLPLSGASALQAWNAVNVSTPGIAGFSLTVVPGSGLFSFGVPMPSVCTGADPKQNKAWAIHYDLLRTKFVFHKFSLGPAGTLVDNATLVDPAGMWPTDMQHFSCSYGNGVLWLYGGLSNSSTSNILYRVSLNTQPLVVTPFYPQAGVPWPSAMAQISSAMRPRTDMLYLMGGFAMAGNPSAVSYMQEFWSLNTTSVTWTSLTCRTGGPGRYGRTLVATDDSIFALQHPLSFLDPIGWDNVTLGALYLSNVFYRVPTEPDWNGTYELSTEPMNVYYNVTVQHRYGVMILIDRNSTLAAAPNNKVPRNVQHVMMVGGIPNLVAVNPQNINQQTIVPTTTPSLSAVHLVQVGTHNCSADQTCKWGDTTGRYACFDRVGACTIRDVYAPDKTFYMYNSSAANMSCTSILLKNCTYAAIGPQAFYRSDVLSSDDVLISVTMDDVVLTDQTEWRTPFIGLTALQNIVLTNIDAPYPFRWLASAAPSSNVLVQARVLTFPSLVELDRQFIAKQPMLRIIRIQQTGLYALPARMLDPAPPSIEVVDFTHNMNLTSTVNDCAFYQSKWSRALAIRNLTYSMAQPASWTPSSVCTWVEDVDECGNSTDPWIPNGVNSCKSGCTNQVYTYYPAGVPVGYTCGTVCTISNVYSTIPLNRSLVAAAVVNNTCKSVMISHSIFTAAWRTQITNDGSLIAVLTGVESDAFLDITNDTLQISFYRVVFRFIPKQYVSGVPFSASATATSWYITPFPYLFFAAFSNLLSVRLRISSDLPIDPDTIAFIWGLDGMPQLQDMSIKLTPQISFMEQTFIARLKRASPMLRSVSLDMGEILHFGNQIGFPHASQNLTVLWSPMHATGYDWTACDVRVLAAVNGTLNNSAVPFSMLNPSFIMSSMLVADASMVSMPDDNLKTIPRRACQMFANVNQCGTRSPAAGPLTWRYAVSPPDYAVAQVDTDAAISICNVTGAAYAFMPDLGIALVWGGRPPSTSGNAAYNCADGVKYWNSRLRSWTAPAKVVGSLPSARVYAAGAYIPHLRAVLIYGGADSRLSGANAMNGQRLVPLGQQIMLLSVLQDDAQQSDAAYLVDPLPLSTVYAAQITLDDTSASLLAPRVGASAIYVPTVGSHGSVLFFGGSPNATAIGSDAWGLGIGAMESVIAAINPVQASDDLIAWDVDTFRATELRAHMPCTAPAPTNWSALNGTTPAAYVPCVAMPPGRSFHVAIYDAMADAMIIHGGEAWMDVSEVEFNASDPSTAPRQWARTIMGDLRIFDVASRTWKDRPYLSTEWAAMYDHGVFTVRRSRHQVALDSQTRLLYLFGGIGFKEPPNPGFSDKYTLPTGAYGSLGEYPVLLDDVIVYDLQRQVWDRPPALHKRLQLLPSGLWFPGASRAGVQSLGGMAWFDEVQREFVVTSGVDKLPAPNDFTSREGSKVGATIIKDGSTPCDWNAGYECTDLEDTLSTAVDRDNQCSCPGPVYNTVYNSNKNTITSCLYCPRCPTGYFDDQGCLVRLSGVTVDYARNCKPWTVCNATQYEWTPPNATADRVCKAFPGPVMPICSSFALAGVVSPAVSPVRSVCVRPESSPIFAVVTGPSANLYPAGRTFGDICYVACGDSLFGWGPSVYVCGETGTWVPAIAVDRNNAPIWPVDPSNIAGSVRFRADTTGAASFATPSYACYDLTPPPIGSMSGGTCGVGMSAKWQLSGPLRGFATLQALAAGPWSTSAEATAQVSIARAALTHSAASYKLVGLLTDNSTGQLNASQVTTMSVASTIVVYSPSMADVKGGEMQLDLYLPIVNSMLRGTFTPAMLANKIMFIAVQAVGHTGSVSDVRWGPSLAIPLSATSNGFVPMLPNLCEPISFLPLANNVQIDAYTIPRRLIVSDSLAPAVGVFSARKNPARNEVVRIRCVTSAPVAISPFDQFIMGGTSPLSFVGANVSLSVSMNIERNTSAPPIRIYSATCDISSTYSSTTLLAPLPLFNFTQQLSFELAIVRTFWPFFRDAVLEIPKQPLIRSAWSSYPANITQLTKALHVPNSTAISDTLRIANNVSLTPTNNSVFMLTVSGAANLTLVGDDVNKLNGGPMFSMDTKVYVGSTLCRTTAVSDDGRLLRILTPPYDVACPSTNTKRSCGVLPITVNNSQWANPAAATVGAAATASAADVLVGGFSFSSLDSTISCPPFCPGSGGATSFIANGSYPTRSLVATSSYVRSSGLLYVLKCSEAFGALFADPATGVCSDVNNPLSRKCAFGEGDACRACPVGALCPGGFRAHPLYGYWNQDETSDNVLQCRPPAGRCLGWSDVNSSSICGDRFRQGSYACSSCAAGYYPSDSVTCSVCPEPNVWNMVRPILSFVGGLAAVGLAILGVVVGVTRQAGGDPKIAARQTAQFVLYCWVALQSMVQVGRAAGPGLPSFLAGAYSAIAALQFQGVSMPPACLQDANPFQGEYAQMGVVIILMLLLVLLQFNYRRWCGCYCCGVGRDLRPMVQQLQPSTNKAKLGDKKTLQPSVRRSSLMNSIRNIAGSQSVRMLSVGSRMDTSKPRLRKLVFTLMTLLYATVTNSTLGVLHCTPITTSVRSYLSLENDGTTLRTAGITQSFDPACVSADCDDEGQIDMLASSVSVSVLSSNPSYVCYEGFHWQAAVVAWTVFLVYVLAYPVLTFALVARRSRQIMLRGSTANAWMQARASKQAWQSAWISSASNVIQAVWRRARMSWICGSQQPPKPLTSPSPARLSSTSNINKPTTPDAFMDTNEDLLQNVSLSHFTSSDFRISRFYFKQLDMVVLFALSCILVFWSRPTSTIRCNCEDGGYSRAAACASVSHWCAQAICSGPAVETRCQDIYPSAIRSVRSRECCPIYYYEQR
jgi:hypothetical protein